jgi:hypothetical protein
MKIVKHFNYPDEHGHDNVRAVRVEQSGKPKKLWMEHRVDGGWNSGENGTELGLFQGHDAGVAMANGDWVFVVEGENKARMLHRRGLHAVSAPHGTSGAKVYANGAAHVMRGAKVAILPDNNDPGTTYARRVAQLLRGVAARIRIVDPVTWGKKDKDIADWLVALDDEGQPKHSADELMRIVRRTKDWSLDAEDLPRDAPRRGGIELIAWDDIKADRTAHYTIYGIMPRKGQVLVYGPRKIGKTYWMTDTAIHIAMKAEYYGHAVYGGPVVYICLEGSDTIKARIEAHRIKHNAHGVPYYLIVTPFKLAMDGPELVQKIKSELPGVTPRCVVIDTLNRAVHGSERDDTVMGEYVDAGDDLVAEWGCLVIHLHHEGLATGRPRGHTLVPAAVETIIRVDGDKAALRTWGTVEESRNVAVGTRIDLQLEPYGIGNDNTGKEIKVLVVASGSSSQVDVTPDPGPRLSDKQQLIFAHPEDIADDKGRASSKQWFKTFRQQSLRDDPGREYDTDRKAFDRACAKLIKEGMITVEDDTVTIIS